MAHIWALSHIERRRRRRALVKGLLALKRANASVFMWFGKQVTLCQIQEG